MSRTSTQRLKIISNILLGVSIILILSNFITDIIKIFFFDRLYVLIYLDETKIDHSDLSFYFSFISISIVYFLFVQLPFEACCMYSAINCMIILTMYKELNKEIEDGKFKIIASDLRKIQLIHNRISRMTTKLSRIMSIPLFLVYYRIIADICRFAFHIVSYIREPTISGLLSCN